MAAVVNKTGNLVAADVALSDEIDVAVMRGAGFPSEPTQLASDVGNVRILEVLRQRHEVTD
ncbi:3-hydroxyacyl-CoA dehydrogenase family protein [Haladaptatus sp. DFWS20]|uniref:3-hydroxyacyl-CoA dehydrogenase family protein n=1 Tax=Haladaptatus sp. DFWS20 TaxID=3403467 RepID=UPI003EBC5224